MRHPRKPFFWTGQMTAASRDYHILEKMTLLIHSQPNVKQAALPIKARNATEQKRSSAGDLIIPALLFFPAYRQSV
jgi:hypothetical protein